MNNKILFIAHLNKQTNNSATENYVIECINAFKRKGIKIYITDYSLQLRLLELGMDNFYFRGVFKINSGFFSILNAIIFLIISKIRKKNINVLSYNIARKYLFFYKIAKMSKVDISFWILDYYPEKNIFYKKCLMNYAKNVISINNNIAFITKNICPTTVFYGGYEGEVFKPKTTKSNSSKAIKLVYAGSLSKLNGIELLINLAKNSSLNLSLDIYGKGELIKLVTRAANENCNIHYFGIIKRELVIKKLKEADFLPLPRKTDDEYHRWFFPSKIIEMLAMPGTTICSEMNGVTDVISEVAVIKKLHSWKDLEKTILDNLILTDQELLTIGKRKEILFRTEFNWDKLPELLTNTK